MSGTATPMESSPAHAPAASGEVPASLSSITGPVENKPHTCKSGTVLLPLVSGRFCRPDLRLWMPRTTGAIIWS